MGTSYEISCKNCSFKKEVNVGIGMMHSTPDAWILSTSKNDQKKIKEIKSKNKEISFTTNGYSVFRCSKCAALSNNFHLKVSLNQEVLFDNSPVCKKCEIVMDLLTVDENQIKIKGLKCCPKCKNEKIIVNESMLWD
tara:strand:- start:66 stop:476 length:411 start_codon:yes stop_codon:yes gene_type:complete